MTRNILMFLILLAVVVAFIAICLKVLRNPQVVCQMPKYRYYCSR